ncbi:hypothetical protein CCACVL1_08620 [Corchorus capsularis]|uniref:Uncharacterized protein n=1 Tax=Corchorus capsularis TaxID=210143 RepID=A0A1R3IZF8_COCAP|nr:hypothetical protein CCACVL1_08620 [Corchorus capsularis]
MEVESKERWREFQANFNLGNSSAVSMAFVSILRKSANSLAPLAIRLTRVQNSCIATIALNHGYQSQKPNVNKFYPNTLHFSTAAASVVDGFPKGFPFDIQDNHLS